ncbi:AsmA family protein [Tabrizicola oligotrophica]|uniref:AsmA family protein n=1 Tax=Tabrizicola oligotrophica TaxID=2710650 RepID=A0A6M0QVI8_9RHOB|nr:AsmA family protein [Tabrizicola oligotrophica]NEY91439.1 AsmA family protein [Tabrizicola oligotrophica]
MRWIVRSVFALLTLAVLAMGALFLIPAERIAGLVVGQFNSLTGRQLVIEGSIRPTIWPVLGVKTGKVTMSNADWSDEGPMFQAEGLEIAVDMAALIGGQARITAVEAVAPVLILERARDGRENWIFGGESGGTVSTATPGVGKAFTLDRAVISNGRLVFLDHGSGTRLDLTALDLETAIAEFDGPVTVQMSAEKEGQPFQLDLTLGVFRDFLDGKLGPVEASFAAGKAEGTFSGKAGWNPMAAKGELEADLGTLAEVAALAGASAPALPEGLGAGGVRVKGGVTLTDKGTVHLRGGTVVLDGTVLAVDADLTQGEARPKLAAKVVAGVLNLAAVSGGKGGGAQGGMKADGWPKDKIDVSALAMLDADVSLRADGIDLGMAKLGASAVKLTLDRARAVFELSRVQAYGGAVSGQFVVNGRKGLSVGGDLGFAGMALQPLMTDLAGYERLVGTGDLRLKFLGSGNSVEAIMQGLEGSGTLALGKGEILGLDIGGMLRTLDTGYAGEGQKTIFDSLTAGFTIAGGVLQNDDLVMQAPFATVRGAGRLGLGARTINYRLRAEAAVGDKTLTAPILIKGPWADPSISLDLEALAKEKLDLEKAELEAAAKEKAKALEAEAKAKVQEELGIVPQDGESLEDAVKRQGEEFITDEAAKALEKLLNGGN